MHAHFNLGTQLIALHFDYPFNPVGDVNPEDAARCVFQYQANQLQEMDFQTLQIVYWGEYSKHTNTGRVYMVATVDDPIEETILRMKYPNFTKTDLEI